MKPVTLWVDAISPSPGGIGRYTWELAKGLMGNERLSAHFFGRGRMLDDPSVLLRGEPPARRFGEIQRWLETRSLKQSLVHGPNYFLPPFAEGGIITVHDLSVFRFPETHPPERVAAFEKDFLNSLSRAAHVITDTETIRVEVMEMFAVRPDDLSVIPLGVDPGFAPMSHDSAADALREFGLEPTQYGLCVSTLEPRKKIAELLEAWRLLPLTLRDRFPLVLCGGAGWQNSSLHAEVERATREGWLRHLGFVDEAKLPALYAGAALFVYPSSYEGFGLPPVEAMASGVPVIVSGCSCLPEVCGDAAQFVDPDDTVTFSEIIGASLQDEDLRAQSIRRGLARARMYSWQLCVDSTIAIYQRFR